MDYLFEVGPTEAGGMGPAPLSHQELLAWQINMRRMLQPWEITMLRRLSAEWVAESQRAEDPDCRAPYAGEITEQELLSVASNLKSAVKMMAAGR